MAHLGIKARIVDKRSDKLRIGGADGVHARTQEIFDSFGFGDRLVKEGNPCVETYFWVCYTFEPAPVMQQNQPNSYLMTGSEWEWGHQEDGRGPF
jgi:2-polyprenyl-6-methoxyphenol hydroxylase-like FAD-dependent oxidoreductase